MIAKTRRLNKPLSVVLMMALMLSALCLGDIINYSAEVDAANDYII